MGEYKVLLVDDEPEVMEAVIKKVEWEKIGYEVIGYAQNGEEALELAEINTPDVVLTDIKMPFMDGLTLSRRLKERFGRIKIIIFSGFDEFEYARDAIKIEVEEYILKPMKLNELTEIFIRIRDLLNKERDEKLNIDKLQEYYLKSLPVLRDQFYIGLIEGRMGESQIENYRQTYQIQMEGEGYAVTVVRVDEEKQDKENAMSPELRNLSIKQIVDENLKQYKFTSFLYFEKIIYIIILEREANIKKYVDEMDRICKMIGRMLKVNVTAGIGSVQKELKNLNHSYEGAKNAVFYSGEGEKCHAAYIEELQPEIKEDAIFDVQNIQKIINQIKLGDLNELQSQIEGFFKQMKERKVSIQQLQIILMGIITELYKLGGAYEINLEAIFGGDLGIYQKLIQLDSVEVVQGWIIEICFLLRKSISKERKNTAQVLIDKAINYMEENYGDCELSIEKICNELNVSSAYFSTIFKRETGKTFLNYLTEIRMQKAILLLDGTEDKTYIICKRAGYSEPNYFSYVFKKTYGMSPSKYRRIRLEQNDSESEKGN